MNAPAFFSESFVCPHCGAFAAMEWKTFANFTGPLHGTCVRTDRRGWFGAQCAACQDESIWTADIRSGIPAAVKEKAGRLIWPPALPGVPASEDVPSDALKDYNEARAVAAASPRAAAALLRLCIQRLCMHLGQPGENINKDIGALVKAGLSPTIQQALDYVRVVGNNAVHPGKLAEEELEDALPYLFWAVDTIVSECITRPRLMAERFGTLPLSIRAGIQGRDSA